MTERAFSTMKLVKTRLQNKMEEGFLTDCFLIYIEKDIAIGFWTDEIIDEFDTEMHYVPFDWKLFVCVIQLCILLLCKGKHYGY
jgi:hypothetical protein